MDDNIPEEPSESEISDQGSVSVDDDAGPVQYDVDESDDESDNMESGADDDEANEDNSDSASVPEAMLRSQLSEIPLHQLEKATKLLNARNKKRKLEMQRKPDSEGVSESEESIREDISTKKKKEPRKGRGVPRHLQKTTASDDRHPGPSQVATLEKKDRKPKKQISKRSNKHAPQEVSSKRPVSRNRPTVPTQATQTPKHRDPRFSSLSGVQNTGLFRKSYEFLDDAKMAEIESLRKLSKQKNLPAAERERVNKTLLRLESDEKRKNQERRNQQAIKQWKDEENAKRAAGKKPFYLKKGAQKEIILRERYEDLSKNKRKLHKAVDKRRRKQAQKEKKAMPPERMRP